MTLLLRIDGQKSQCRHERSRGIGQRDARDGESEEQDGECWNGPADVGDNDESPAEKMLR